MDEDIRKARKQLFESSALLLTTVVSTAFQNRSDLVFSIQY